MCNLLTPIEVAEWPIQWGILSGTMALKYHNHGKSNKCWFQLVCNLLAPTNIEEDDDSRAIVPRQKKRQIVKSDPEDAFDVPKEIECNPMAPVTKKHRQLDVKKPPCTLPPLLPLQPTAPTQVPPSSQPNPKRCPVPTSQLHLQSASECRQPQFHPQPKKFQPQDKTVATSKPLNLSRIPDEDDPMQDDDKNERGSTND
jgi:hypothetical protein